MTPEEKRDRLLKRILPAMAIFVIYFVFISGVFSEKMNKAETDYTNMIRKGISPSAIPSALKQQQQLQTQINTLESRQRELKQKLTSLAGFLSNATPSNESSTLLSNILAKYDIRVKNEQRVAFPEADLSPALQQVWHWLKPEEETGVKNKAKKNTTNKNNQHVYVQHLSVSGSYQNMYLAMDSIASGELKAVPVYLTMKTPDDVDNHPGILDWELMLWM